MGAIEEVIKKSNEELYEETMTPGYDPQDSNIDQLLKFVELIKNLII